MATSLTRDILKQRAIHNDGYPLNVGQASGNWT